MRIARLRSCTARSFTRDRRGATAIEFSLLALPFVFAMFAILEYGYVYLINASMDNAVALSARLIRTGRAQTTSFSYFDPVSRTTKNTSVPMTSSDFANLVCANMTWVANCAGSLQVSAEVQSGYTGQTSTPPTQNGQLRTNLPFNMGADRCIVLIHSYYTWQMITPTIWSSATKLNNNGILLTSGALILNEAYSQGSPTQPANAC